MAWSTTSDGSAFLAEAQGFLAADPVAHAGLLSEAGYLAARPDPAAVFGVLRDDAGSVVAAYVAAPRHPVLLSSHPPDLPSAEQIEVDSGDAHGLVVGGGWHGVGRIRLHRLTEDADPDPDRIDPDGSSRLADESDRVLLTGWYSRLLGGLDDDATDLAFLVDEPLSCGGAVLWEHRGEPVGVAVRARPVAGVTKVTAAWSPTDPAYADAAFLAACAVARVDAATVVAVDRPGADDSLLRSAGFVPEVERVLLVRV